ncbi:MAG: tryptophan 7-halogenase [Proteobacteria bacterium]|nr:tryptophan 7-halogenase [Pseudomonadota bacterium]
MKRYDCVIMGAGFAGNCLARHLKLHNPALTVALIDPRGNQRGDRDLKVGESTIEIAALFLNKELGLVDYMSKHHVTKTGLHFHWPKKIDNTGTMDDYFSIWETSTGFVPTFNMNRAKFETDLLRMNMEMGVEFFPGHVVDFELTPGDTPHRVTVKLDDGQVDIEADHLVDAAGHRFLIGRKVDNLIEDTEQLYGIRNGSAWLRVRGVDRDLFERAWNPERGVTSSFYATNHFFGHGHWVWMIPSASADDELSVGVIYHKDKIPAKSLARREQFLSFLQHNHNVLYKMVCSGHIVDFKIRRQVAYRSRRLMSNDNWYVVGDAAYNIDAFYSMGTSVAAMMIECISQVVRDKVAGRDGAYRRCELYNDFNLATAHLVNGLLREHSDQIGNPSAMSWRTYLELTWWFGFSLPIYVGRYHLNEKYIALVTKMTNTGQGDFFAEAIRSLGEIANRGLNIGMLDFGRADTLGFGHRPETDIGDYFVNTKFEMGRLNLFSAMGHATRYSILWYLKLHWRAGGLPAILRPRIASTVAKLTLQSLGLGILATVHRLETRRRPNNREISELHREFAGYRPHKHLRPWFAASEESDEQKVSPAA